MDLQSSKKSISSFFKERGFVQTSSKRILVQDHGFFLIVIEYQPVGGNMGFILRVAIKFLWSTFYAISYDYPRSNNSILVPGSPICAILFDNPDADLLFNRLLDDAMVKIREYQELKNFSGFKNAIKTRYDYCASFAPQYVGSEDVSSAIVKMLSGETEEAVEILRLESEHREVARRLFANCNDIEQFQSELINIINNCRSELSSKLKIKLNPIESVWNFN